MLTFADAYEQNFDSAYRASLAFSGGERCAQMPENALEAIRTTDALVSVYEREGDHGGDPRPDRFKLTQGSDPGELDDCVSDETILRDRQIPFKEGDRYFVAYVALGPNASSNTEAEDLEILDALVLP